MAAVFDDWGVRFEYPENWSLDSADATGEPLSVAISSPGGAFWSLNVYDRDMPLDGLIEEVIDAMRTEYPTLEVERVGDSVEDLPLEGCDLSFFYLDLCSTALVRGFGVAGRTFLVMCQAEDREMQKLEAVFAAINASLVRGVQGAP